MHGELVPVPRSALDTDGTFAPAIRTARVGAGLVGLVVRGASAAVTGRRPADGGPPHGAALLGGAAIGFAMEVERRTLHAAGAVVEAGSSAVRGVARLPGVRGPAARFEAWLVELDAEARAQQRENRADADATARRLVQMILDVMLDYVDFAHVVEQIPMDEIVDRIDIEAVMAKLDLGSIVDRAMKDIDLGGIIRESTEGVTAEAVDAVRSQTVKTDLFVSRIVDRVLLRKEPRDLELPEPEADGPAREDGA